MGTLDLVTLSVWACVQCIIIAYGTIAVVVPLLKLRAARKRAQEDGERTEAGAQPA